MQQERMSTSDATLNQSVQQLAERWSALERQVRRMVDERPLTTVLAALFAGYLVARVTSRT